MIKKVLKSRDILTMINLSKYLAYSLLRKVYEEEKFFKERIKRIKMYNLILLNLFWLSNL